MAEPVVDREMARDMYSALADTLSPQRKAECSSMRLAASNFLCAACVRMYLRW